MISKSKYGKSFAFKIKLFEFFKVGIPITLKFPIIPCRYANNKECFIIPIILQALETRGLDISLQIHEADLDELNTLLVQGTIDVALTYNMFPNPSIEFETLIEEKPYVMIARNDPLASKKSIALKELVEKDMVSLNLPLTQQYFLSCFSQHNLRPKVRHQTKSYELVRSLVGAGEGYAIMIMRPVTNRA